MVILQHIDQRFPGFVEIWKCFFCLKVNTLSVPHIVIVSSQDAALQIDKKPEKHKLI